jgi:hypothetical protein
MKENSRDSYPRRLPKLFHRCASCRAVGLKPGILATKHGDYGIRDSFKDQAELELDEAGLCEQCANFSRDGV